MTALSVLELAIEKELLWNKLFDATQATLWACLSSESSTLRILSPEHILALPIVFPESKFWNSKEFEKNLVTQLSSRVSLLIDSRLKFGIKRTKSKVRLFYIMIEPALATFERDPSAIMIVKFWWHELYLWKILAFLVMLSDSPKSTIHGLIFSLLTFKAFKNYLSMPRTWSSHRGERSLLWLTEHFLQKF